MEPARLDPRCCCWSIPSHEKVCPGIRDVPAPQTVCCSPCLAMVLLGSLAPGLHQHQDGCSFAAAHGVEVQAREIEESCNNTERIYQPKCSSLSCICPSSEPDSPHPHSAPAGGLAGVWWRHLVRAQLAVNHPRGMFKGLSWAVFRLTPWGTAAGAVSSSFCRSEVWGLARQGVHGPDAP